MLLYGEVLAFVSTTAASQSMLYGYDSLSISTTVSTISLISFLRSAVGHW